MTGKKGIPNNHVDIALFDHPTFAPMCTAMENMRTLFSCNVGPVDPVAYGENMGIQVIRCENRVASYMRDVPAGTIDLPVDAVNDPRRIFQKQVLSARSLRFTEDNEILFYRAENVTGYAIRRLILNRANNLTGDSTTCALFLCPVEKS